MSLSSRPVGRGSVRGRRRRRKDPRLSTGLTGTYRDPRCLRRRSGPPWLPLRVSLSPHRTVGRPLDCLPSPIRDAHTKRPSKLYVKTTSFVRRKTFSQSHPPRYRHRRGGRTSRTRVKIRVPERYGDLPDVGSLGVASKTNRLFGVIRLFTEGKKPGRGRTSRGFPTQTSPNFPSGPRTRKPELEFYL